MRFLTLALCWSLSGCSLLFTTSAPDTVTAYTKLDCTTRKTAPAIDAIATVVQGIGVGYYVDQGGDLQSPAFAAGLGWLGLYAISTIYGFSVVSGCRDAHEEQGRLAQQEAIRQRFNHWQPY